MSQRVMIYVQHLLGIGHLKRMSLLADDLAEAGADVLLVSGGPPAPHVQPSSAVRFHQLAPVRALDETFLGLADQNGRVIGEPFKARRRDDLLQQLKTFGADVLVVELFPLGRRQMRFELLPLLQAARGTCRTVACSVRDIVNRRPHREAESIDWLNSYFDLLLVHGDERLTPITDSVAGIGAFKGKIVHTGYLTEDWKGPASRGSEVMVTAGGGAAGEHLFLAAAAASRQTGDALTWRIRHGLNASPKLVQTLHDLAAPTSHVEPVADDFREQLSRCAVSVSQFGYNTAMDLIATHTPAIVVPFSGGGETEQRRRAEALGDHVFRVIPEEKLDGRLLASAVTACANESGVPAIHVDMDGLHRSTSLLLGS